MIILDRMDADIAYVEWDGEIREVARARLDTTCKPGDVLLEQNGQFLPNAALTAQRKAEMQMRLERLVRNKR